MAIHEMPRVMKKKKAAISLETETETGLETIPHRKRAARSSSAYGVAQRNTGHVIEDEVVIKAPNLKTGVFHIRGTAPLVMHRFGEKARGTMKDTMLAGSQAKSKKVKEVRDFNLDFEEAKHVSTEGWYGIPAGALKASMVEACKMVGFFMTHAKPTITILSDGIDRAEGVGLVRLEAGEPEWNEQPVRIERGKTDIRVRPMWREWDAHVRIQWDDDILSHTDLTNLLLRAGSQMGILEGRPNSPKSKGGMGWGTFEIVND